jgi:hypothetical protein
MIFHFLSNKILTIFTYQRLLKLSIFKNLMEEKKHLLKLKLYQPFDLNLLRFHNVLIRHAIFIVITPYSYLYGMTTICLMKCQHKPFKHLKIEHNLCPNTEWMFFKWRKHNRCLFGDGKPKFQGFTLLCNKLHLISLSYAFLIENIHYFKITWWGPN